MAKIVKKKKGLGGGALARSSVGRATSNLKPKPVTKLPLLNPNSNAPTRPPNNPVKAPTKGPPKKAAINVDR